MSCLKSYSFIFTSDQLQKLREHNVRSVLDFIQEKPDNINRATGLHFKDIVEIKEKLTRSFRGNPLSGFELFCRHTRDCKNLPSGIPAIDKLIGGELEVGVSYELCGLSGSGKTQICLHIAAHVACVGHKVFYVDTKNDFSANRVRQMMLPKNKSKEDEAVALSRIVITKVNDLYQLISVLHNLKTALIYEKISLVVIDCVSTLYFFEIGRDDNLGSGLLNHCASLINYLKTEHHITFVLTNLAAKSLHERQIKPCLGNYWQQVCNIRIMTSKMNSMTNTIVLRKDSRSEILDLSSM